MSVPILLAWYLLASIATFIAYAVDKRQAVRKRWRVSEATLQTMSLLGGWPGALVGQRVLRHKTSKTPFLVVFWVTVVVNSAFAVAIIRYILSRTSG